MKLAKDKKDENACKVYRRRTKNIDLTILLLETLKQTSLASLDLVDAMLNSYPLISEQSRARRSLNLNKTSAYREKIIGGFFDKQKERRRIASLIQRLKRSGLIGNDNVSGKGKKLRIMAGGVRRLLEEKGVVYLPETDYQPSKREGLVVIIFDIREKDRAVRDWLRDNLDRLGFRIEQRSVYVGERRLPQYFIDDLKRLELIPKQVKIFSVNKEGSLFD